MMLGNAEIDVIQKRTWGLVLFLKEKAIIGVKWIFRTKYNANRSISNVRSVDNSYSDDNLDELEFDQWLSMAQKYLDQMY